MNNSRLKQITALALSCLLIFGSMPASVVTGFRLPSLSGVLSGIFDSVNIKASAADVYTDTATGLKFTGSGTATIVGFTDDIAVDADGKFIIPDTINYDGNDYAVQTIAATAFRGCDLIKTLVINSNIRKIEGGAFAACPELTTVYFNSNNCTMPNENVNNNVSKQPAFVGCNKLESIIFGENVTSIPDYVCRLATNLKTVSFGSKVTSIGQYAFAMCSGALETVDLSGIDTVGNYAFDGCAALKSADFSSIKDIGNAAFRGCTSLTNVNFNLLQSIGNNAFERAGITTLIITADVSSIGAGAFANCTSLSSVNFNTITCTMPAVFNQTTNLAKYETNLANNGTITYAATPAFNGCTELKSFTFGAGIKKIPDYVCFAAANLSDVTFTDNVNTIGDYAFFGTKVNNIDLSKVTTIGDAAFYGCANLSNVALSSALTGIGMKAFFKSGLAELTVPENVVSIGANAFASCHSLTSVQYNATSSTVNGGNVFGDDTALTSFVFSNELITIPANVCRGADNLTNIVISNNADTIEDYAFSGCAALTSIDIKGVTSIGSHAFERCSHLANIDLSKVTSIGDYTFAYCSDLQNVNLSSSLRTIGVLGFYSSGLRELTIPENVVSIGANAFGLCNYLKTLYYNANSCILPSEYQYNATNDAQYIEKKPAFYSCVRLEKIVFGPNVSAVPAYLCRKVENLREVEFGTGIKSVGAYAFEGCTNNLESIDFSTVETIGANAFSGCSVLSTVNFTSSLLTIGNAAFYGTGISELTIPENVTTIGSNAFGNCTSLKTVYFNATGCTMPSTTDGKEPSANGSNLATAAFNASPAISRFVFGSRVTSIPAFICRDMTGLDTVEFKGTVTAIGDYAFSNCSGKLRTIDLSNVTSIGNSAFSECSKLSNIDISKVETIAAKAFYNCESITEINFSDKLESIGSLAFYGTDITSLTIPVRVTSIGSGAFNNCSYLQTLTYNPANCTIGDAIFTNDFLTTAAFGSNVTKIPANILKNAANLRTVTFNGAVTEIGSNAFNGCSQLSAVDLSKVTAIGENAFYNCGSIKNINLTETLTSIGKAAFYGTGIKELIIPMNVKSIGDGAFANCLSLEAVTLNAAGCSFSGSSPVFAGCQNLKDATFSEKLVNIPANVMRNANALKTITFKGTVTNVGDNSFLGCNAVSDIYYSGSIDNWGVIKWGSNNDRIKNAKDYAGYDPAITNTAWVHLTPKAWTITYKYTVEGVSGETIFKEEAYYAGDPIRLIDAIPEKTGYDFSGWSSLPSVMPSQDITVTGTFTLKRVTKTSNGVIVAYPFGTFDTDDDSSMNITATVLQRTDIDYISFFEKRKDAKDTIIIYNVMATKDNQVVKALGRNTVTVKIPMPDGVNANTDFYVLVKKYGSNEIYRWEKNDSRLSTEGNYIVFSWKYLGMFAICAPGSGAGIPDIPDAVPAVHIYGANSLSGKTYDYKTTFILHAYAQETDYFPHDSINVSNIHWYVNGRDTGITGSEYKINKATSSRYTIVAKYVNGNNSADSETITLNINTGFFARLLAFFKGLFGSLPTVERTN
ncbi:MAG: leucine-rich repeat domain-containing protein [Clostridiales bacterium]|nr:leucine-rich repeat domain-containing protein [Clostridiales bacterium]